MPLYPGWELLLSWVAVVETGSVSEAARRLQISQAAVSQHVKQLELGVGVELLDRSFRPARPTAAGQRLYEDASELLHKMHELVEHARGSSRGKRTLVRIGCVDSFAATLGPSLIKGLSGASRQIRLWSGLTPALNSQLENRQLDLSVTTEVFTHKVEIEARFLFSEAYLFVLPRDYDVPGTNNLVEIAKDLPFIRYSSRSVIGREIEAYLASLGASLENTYEFDATDPLLSLVAARLGFALTTPICMWQSRHFLRDIRALPLSELRSGGKPCPPLYRSFYLMARKDELGRLPLDVFNIVSEVAQRQLSLDISRALGLPEQTIFRFQKPGA